MRSICRMIFVAVLMLIAGCLAIDESLLLRKGTKVEIVDATSGTLFSTSVKEGVDLMKKRIMELTIEELEKRSIEAVMTPTPGTAKLKYDFRTVSAGYGVVRSAFITKGFGRYEVKYRVSLESPDGKKIFSDNDEKDDSDIDHVLETIAKRVAGFVKRSFKE